jgi:hypothetical protein
MSREFDILGAVRGSKNFSGYEKREQQEEYDRRLICQVKVNAIPHGGGAYRAQLFIYGGHIDLQTTSQYRDHAQYGKHVLVPHSGKEQLLQMLSWPKKQQPTIVHLNGGSSELKTLWQTQRTRNYLWKLEDAQGTRAQIGFTDSILAEMRSSIDKDVTDLVIAPYRYRY